MDNWIRVAILTIRVGWTALWLSIQGWWSFVSIASSRGSGRLGGQDSIQIKLTIRLKGPDDGVGQPAKAWTPLATEACGG